MLPIQAVTPLEIEIDGFPNDTNSSKTQFSAFFQRERGNCWFSGTHANGAAVRSGGIDKAWSHVLHHYITPSTTPALR